MNNPCTPPPGTAEWHFLMHGADVTRQAHWSHGIWWPLDIDWGYTENRYGELGWRYVGPVCIECPGVVTTDQHAVVNSQGQGAAAATSAAPEPTPPAAKDALLRETLEWLEDFAELLRIGDAPEQERLAAFITKTRASLKGE